MKNLLEIIKGLFLILFDNIDIKKIVFIILFTIFILVACQFINVHFITLGIATIGTGLLFFEMSNKYAPDMIGISLATLLLFSLFGKETSHTRMTSIYKQYGVVEKITTNNSNAIIKPLQIVDGFGVYKVVETTTIKKLEIMGIELKSTLITFEAKKNRADKCSHKFVSNVHKNGYSWEISNDDVCPKQFKERKWVKLD